MSSPFGMRDGVMHNGIDFAAAKGTPIYAPADGLVVEGIERAGVQGFGKWVWLDCQDSVGFDFIMGHCDPLVKKNQTVRAGDLIARVNSHGQSTGPHNHFEVWTSPGRVGGSPINPQRWLDSATYKGDEVAEVKPLRSPVTRSQISPNKHKAAQNISWIAIHTQQGKSNAAGLVNYLCNPASEVSYHYVVDDEETVEVVPENWCPWSASNANNRAIHVCLAGTFAEWSRDKWLEKDSSDGVNEDLMLARTAELVAWIGSRYPGVPLVYVGGGSQPPKANGVCGHKDFGQWGGNHFDPGPNFPWDEFMRRITAFSEGGAMGFLEEKLKNFKGDEQPVRTVLFYMDKFINEIREQLGPWAQLGKNEEGKNLTLVDSQAVQNKKLDLLLEGNKAILTYLQEKLK